MPLKTKNNKGSGFAFLLIMTVITFIIAAVGWYVYLNKYEKIDSSGVAGVIKTVDTSNDTSDKSDYSYLGEFKKIQVKELGLEFEYPKNWLAKSVSQQSKDAGVVVDLVSPQQHQEFLDKQTDIDSDLFISFWNDINNKYALGGDWQDRRTYSSMADYLTSPEFGYKKSLRIVNSEGYDVHFVTIGGKGEKYGVMIENKKGIYEFNFISTPDEKSATPEVKRIIQSIKINEN